MQTIYDIRRNNLRALIDDRFAGSQTALAKAVGLAQPSFVSRLLTKRASAQKNIGTRLARRIEAALGLAPNWFDTPNATRPPDDGVIEIPLYSRSGDYEGAGSFTPEQARALLARAPCEQRVPLLSAVELGRMDHIAAAYQAKPVAEQITVHTKVAPPDVVALRLPDDAMGERFPAGSIVVLVDRDPPYANDFVVGVPPGTGSAVMRQWIAAADRQFLVPLNRQHQAAEVGAEFRLLGVVVEALVFL